MGMVNIHSHLEGGYWNLQDSTYINKEPEESQQPADAAMITAAYSFSILIMQSSHIYVNTVANTVGCYQLVSHDRYN